MADLRGPARSARAPALIRFDIKGPVIVESLRIQSQGLKSWLVGFVSSTRGAQRRGDDDLKAGKSATLLPQCRGGDIKGGGTICHDATKEDPYILLGLLKELGGTEDAFDHLAGSRPLPYFSGPCRWSSAGVNCETFETTIVRQQGTYPAMLDGRARRACRRGVCRYCE